MDQALNAPQVATGAAIRAKNRAAVALGRLGGKKGGPARARRLSAKRRTEIARAGGRARQRGRRRRAS